jgi:uncharacterized protein (TIGR00725 family)
MVEPIAGWSFVTIAIRRRLQRKQLAAYHGRVIIAVIGASQASEKGLAQAEAVGRELAVRGCVLICGGRGGVMEAACRGAAQAGGLTIGILPEADRSAANPHVKVPIVTGMGSARNYIIALSADAVIAIDHGYGTLAELGFALQAGKPIAGLGTWSITGADGAETPVRRFDDPVEAVEWAVAAATKGDFEETRHG